MNSFAAKHRNVALVVSTMIVVMIAFLIGYAAPAEAQAATSETSLQAGALQQQTADNASLTTQAKKYDLWVAGKQVTSKNAKNILGNGTVSYNAKTNTLTMRNAKITKARIAKEAKWGHYHNFGIYSATDKALTIKLVGKNSIKMPRKKSPVNNFGIFGKGDITITGTGSLDIRANKAQVYSIGIVCNGRLTMQGSVKVSTKGASTKVKEKHIKKTSYYGGYGISSSNGLVMKEKAQLIAQGAKKAVFSNEYISFSYSGYTPQVKAGVSAKKIKVNKKNPAKSVYTKYKYVKITKAKASSKSSSSGNKPAKVSISGTQSISNGVRVMFTMPAKNCNAYRVQVSTDSSFSSNSTFTSGLKYQNPNTPMTYTYTNEGFTSGTICYVRVQAVNVTDSKTYYGSWSDVKVVRVS